MNSSMYICLSMKRKIYDKVKYLVILPPIPLIETRRKSSIDAKPIRTSNVILDPQV